MERAEGMESESETRPLQEKEEAHIAFCVRDVAQLKPRIASGVRARVKANRKTPACLKGEREWERRAGDGEDDDVESEAPHVEFSV